MTDETGSGPSYANGVRTGHWKFNDSQGRLVRECAYDDRGAQLGPEIIYDPQTGRIINGRLNNGSGAYTEVAPRWRAALKGYLESWKEMSQPERHLLVQSLAEQFRI